MCVQDSLKQARSNRHAHGIGRRAIGRSQPPSCADCAGPHTRCTAKPTVAEHPNVVCIIHVRRPCSSNRTHVLIPRLKQAGNTHIMADDEHAPDTHCPGRAPAAAAPPGRIRTAGASPAPRWTTPRRTSGAMAVAEGGSKIRGRGRRRRRRGPAGSRSLNWSWSWAHRPRTCACTGLHPSARPSTAQWQVGRAGVSAREGDAAGQLLHGGGGGAGTQHGGQGAAGGPHPQFPPRRLAQPRP